EDHDVYGNQRAVNRQAGLLVDVPANGFNQRRAGLVGLADVVDDRHSADKDFSRREARYQADADFPVEAKRLDQRFNPMPEAPGEAAAKLRASLSAVNLRHARFKLLAAQACSRTAALSLILSTDR